MAGENLPPAGDERRDELKRREDRLAQTGEEVAKDRAIESVNPKAFQPDHDIQGMLDELTVSARDSCYEYCWVNTWGHGRFIKVKNVQGWEVVQGDMEEARELKGIGGDTTRRVGDVILMRIPLDRFRKLYNAAVKRKKAQQEGVDSRLLELGDRYAGEGVSVHTPTNMSYQMRETIEKRAGGTPRRSGSRSR